MSGYWIQTFTGKRFDLIDITEATICIEDIAHQLSIENRWMGACRIPISVGYHSILVSQQLPDKLKLEGLLHDAAEAYIKDLPNPLKRLLSKQSSDALFDGNVLLFGYKKIEFIIENAIRSKFKLSKQQEVWQEVKAVDVRMVITERQALCNHPAPEPYLAEYEDAVPLNIDFQELNFRNVKELFLKEYNKWRRD